MSDHLPIPEFLPILRREIELAGGVRAFSRKTGVNQATVSQCINGRIPVPDAVCNAIGYVKVTTFRKARV